MGRKKARRSAANTVTRLTVAADNAPRDVRVHAPLSETDIATRAYHKWLARGCPLGDDARDWFDAQNELRSESTQPGAVVLSLHA